MYRIVAFIAVLALATIACSLGGEGNAAPTAAPFSLSNFPTATQNVVVVTSTPTVTVAVSSTPFLNNNPGSNCQIQTSWTVYIVQPGDTLGTIAQATGSTVNALTTGNCLSNPDLLSVGQRLRVPRLPLPPTITPPPTQSGVLVAGKVNFSEIVAVVGDNVTLPAGKTITLSYSRAAEAITSVAFVLRSPNGVVGGVIGGDNNLNDGASVSWSVPTLLDGQQVFANGFNAVGNLVVQSQISRVYTTASTEGNIIISPTIDGGGESIHLQAGSTVTITYEGARTDLARAEFALFDPFADGWSLIGTDSDLSDGASVSWVVPLDLTGQIIVASTYTANGIQQQQQSSASLFAQQPTGAD
ncbi:MAG: LysM peptidoglycan-binding domain-containing protein [Chloroflexi bacterium]|nr:LysM peptidoglycan-binding domain-containing protein [Chloroflexota bacterium]